ncbi:phosphatidylinositol-specific phospholipase C/glycerophosphodiester phosphodiesterase family protein [Nocardioides sp. CF8]|uniref:phosphatidylinositol-specific phospholipase C/glycerophosphodiester phosphodiesterase family protein n=1 Tax=Nocardioides sp. CF8 TaxID=110319 RepID=UPI00055CDBE3|nr:phosphatidylinositol-specific phospholipase C/glycerophosphodiester phosphodiesterase family protein [Nocardioides sp. CF8]
MTSRILATLFAPALLASLALSAPAAATTGAAPEPVVALQQAHAHNDYEHQRPLLDALDHGFTSVEADVWLVDGELLVAHDLADVQPGRTLESLYLEPLAKIVADNGGTVHPGFDGTFQLLIDVKSAARPTYDAIHAALAAHEEIITRFQHGARKQRAVDAVISGNRDLAFMSSQKKRFAGYDGRLGDLGSGLSSDVMPLVSDNWTRHFTWQGVGPMPAAERAELEAIVAQAHAAGYRVRFWATPDAALPNREAVWQALRNAGVDHINTDDLAGLQAFLSS